MVLTSIRVSSLVKVLGCIYASLGLIIGVLLAIASLLGAAVGSAVMGSSEPWVGLIFGVGAVIALPIFYGVIGCIVGLLVGLIYNFVAAKVGGLELVLE